MPSKRHGFTIVELLIVIVVIAVLASISVAAFNGIQSRSKNNARYSEIKSWHRTMQAYKATYGDYPSVLVNDAFYCLGEGFPVGGGGVARCRDYLTTDAAISYVQSDNASFMNELRKIGNLPKADRTPVANTVGPYMRYFGTGALMYRIYGAFNGSSAADCPQDLTFQYTSGGLVICVYDSAS